MRSQEVETIFCWKEKDGKEKIRVFPVNLELTLGETILIQDKRVSSTDEPTNLYLVNKKTHAIKRYEDRDIFITTYALRRKGKS